MNLIVSLNIPLKRIVYPIFIIFIIIFAVYLKLNFRTIKIDIRKMLFNFILPIMLILVFQGISYFVIGQDYYLGNRALDTLFYIENPEYLINFPLNTLMDQYPNQPWMTLPYVLNPHRISLTTVHAFLTVLLKTHTLNTLGVMMILPSVMLFCSIKACVKMRSDIYQTIIAFIIAMLPCITNLSLDGFLGAVSCIPFFFLSIYTYVSVLNSKDYYGIPLIILFTNCAITTYTDTFFIVISVFLIATVYMLLEKKQYKFFLISLK